MSFDTILKDLVARLGAEGAVMHDTDGEMVASFSRSPGSEIDLIGAHNAAIFNMVKEIKHNEIDHGDVCSAVITAGGAKLVISAIKEGYCLVVLLKRSSPTGLALIESEKAVRKIEEEMR